MKQTKQTKQTKQVKKIAELVETLKLNPDLKASYVAEKYSCSMNYAYLILQKAKNVHRRNKARMKKAPMQRQADFIDSVPLVGETLAMLPPDMVNSPPHYKIGGIEAIDYIQAKLTPEEFRGYLKGNVLKYTSRAGYKEDAGKDVDKMVWYALKLQSLK
jgi:hypothetical protein